MDQPSFQLTVSIQADLGEQEVRELRAALAKAMISIDQCIYTE